MFSEDVGQRMRLASQWLQLFFAAVDEYFEMMPLVFHPFSPFVKRLLRAVLQSAGWIGIIARRIELGNR
jgi:hypothetical protein